MHHVPTIARAAVLYVAARAGRGEFRPATAREVRYVLGMFSTAVGPERPVAAITRRQALAWWDAQQCSPATARTRLSAVRTFLAWCQAQGWLQANPLLDVRAGKVPRRMPVTLPLPAVAALFDAIHDARGRAMAGLMVHCGLRAGEVASLTMERVDWNQRMLHVVGKGGHERMVPLPSEAAMLLRNYLAQYPAAATGPVFRRYDLPYVGISRRTVTRQFAEWMRAAGVKHHAYDGVSAHGLRRTCATDLLDRGANIRQVQALLGHQHLATTEVYLRRADGAELAPVVEGRTYLQPPAPAA